MNDVAVCRKGRFKNKTVLISIDGMRPDGLKQCGSSAVRELEKLATYTYTARTVFPSVTLPCHYSMTHSVPPTRHGVLTNDYMPPVRPMDGIFERVSAADGMAAMFYGWEPLRDIRRLGTAWISEYNHAYACDSNDTFLTDKAIAAIETYRPDFVFLYMVDTDERGGHDNGWMSKEYLRRIAIAFENAKRIVDLFGEEYSVVITADHGGHDRMHGSDLPEDMTIPMFFIGKEFEKGKEIEGVSILDIAPTLAKIMGITPAPEWEGKVLF